MEDVLEQIVGEIWDETDIVEPEVVEKAEGGIELDGDMVIPDFIDLIGLNAEEFEPESGTVGGWTLEIFGRFPKVGDSFRYGNMELTVLSMSDGRRVEKVLVKLDPPEEKD